MFSKNRKFLLLSAFVLSLSSAAFAKGKKGAYVEISADQLKWFEVPGTPLKMAVAWGDPQKGAHGRFLKLPAGFEAGMHAHTNDYDSVVVSGTWIHWEEGATTPKEFTVGSYVHQPGMHFHNDRCKEGADCILYTHQTGKNDYIPAKAAKKN